MREIVVVGASTWGREVLEYIEQTIANSSDLSVKGFVDDNAQRLEKPLDGITPLDTIDAYPITDSDRFLIAVSNTRARRRIDERLLERGAQFITIVHPTANVSPRAQLGEGTLVAPFSHIGPYARLDRHSLLCAYATIAHDCEVGPYACLSPHSIINGGCVLGEGAFLGSHATLAPLSRAGAYSKVAAASVVYDDVPPESLAIGNPAKARPLLGGG